MTPTMTTICIVAEVLALSGYLLAATAYPLRLLRPERDYTAYGRWGMIGSALLQGMGLLAHSQRPNGGLLGDYATISFVLVLLLCAAVLLVERSTERPAIAAFLTPFIFVFALMGLLRKSLPIPIIHQPWFLPHIVLTLAAYACFALAFMMAMAYLVGDSYLKHKLVERLRLLPPLTTADRVAHRAVAVGLLLFSLGLGIGLVALFDLHNGIDPKVPPALLTWAVYAAYLWLRNARGWRGVRLQALLILGFAMVVLSFMLVRHDAKLHAAAPAAPAAVVRPV